MFQTAFESIALLVICMAIGFAAKKGQVIKNKDMPGLSGLTLNIALPCFMIMSMQREFDIYIFRNSLMVMALAAVIHTVCLLLSLPVTKILKAGEEEKPVLMFAFTFPNIGLMGIPIIYAMYGAEAMFYAAMINVVFNVMLFTAGMAIMRGGAERGRINFKTIVLNKLMLATIIGFLLFLFSVRLPSVLGTALSLVGNMTTPLAMIVIGSMLADNELKSVLNGYKVYAAVLFRLLIIPLLVFFTLRSVIADELAVTVLTVLTAMPVAVIVAIFAAEHNKEPQMASKLVFISTVLSIFTIPLIVLITSSG